MSIKSVTSKTLKSWLDNKEAILIDVREIAENMSNKIKNSILIPLLEIDIDKVPTLDSKKLVIHCKSGKRSLVACEKLTAQNPDLEVYNLDGGIDSWKNDGLEVVSGGESCVPLERQVQIVAGAAVFLGTFFGLLISKLFFIIPLFFGAGLVFAGYSGWCGLGILLKKLPCKPKSWVSK